ncbi:MAG TPA: CHASE3 domain-containing protein [Chthoniobacterales bacterium]
MSSFLKMVVSFSVAALFLLGLSVVSYRMTLLHDAERSWLAHTYQVREQLDSVLTDLLNSQTGERGYLLTGNDVYLTPYRTGIDALQNDVNEVGRLTVDNPVQRSALNRLQPLVTQSLAYLHDRIEARQRAGPAVEPDPKGEALGKALMDQMKAIVLGMKQEEARLLLLRGKVVDTASQTTKAVILGANALAFLFLCAAGFIACREIQQRGRADQASNQNLYLQNAALAKNRFLANMSHELRTPLNGIIGFAEFLVDGKPGALNAKQREYLEDILRSGQHLLQLINDVLDLAKVEAGKMELNPEKFSIPEAVDEVCTVARPIAQKKGIQVAVRVDPEVNEVMLDPQKFKQVLYNLLSNAIKFSPPRATVEILVSMQSADHFKLVVTDSGIGIKPEDLGRLFKEFEQLDTGTARRYEGTGLGLALTRSIVECQGGTIVVASELGKGSSFIVTLPLEAAEMVGACA